jgi:hypothetical protein
MDTHRAGVEAGWEARSVRFVLSADRGRALCQHALCFDLLQGGRFEVDLGQLCEPTTTIGLWSAQRAADGRPAARIGGITLAWDSPEPGRATVSQVCWRPERGGTEAEVWRALLVLMGSPPPTD